jgi:glycosyltransferase involved in cell wall biosynthesis
MRVGIFIGKMQSLKTGGGATFQHNILNQITKASSKHEFYIFYKGKKNIFSDEKNLKFIAIGKRSPWSFIRKSRHKKLALNREILKNKIEILWFATPSYHYVECPFIITVWDLEHRTKSYFPELTLSGSTFDEREELYRNAIPKASYVITGNKEGAAHVNQFYNFPLNRVRTISLPTPQFVYEEKADDKILSKNQLTKHGYLFYPAQFWPHKNHIRIVKALKVLKSQGHDIKVAFSGTDKGNEKYIKEKVQELGLVDDVKFLGFISKAELVSLYKHSIALTFASICGPDNLPPLEAMALNCPVICADNDGMREQLGKESALFFDPLDENDLVKKVKLLLDDKSLREDLIVNGNALSSRLTTEGYIHKFLDLIDEFAPIRECWSKEEKFTHL